MAVEPFFAESSRNAAFLSKVDWSEHPLGPPQAWPANLRGAVSICLNARYPAALCWGPELFLFYNDAYASCVDESKHPRALARPVSETWAERWTTLAPEVPRELNASALLAAEIRWFVPQAELPDESLAAFQVSPLLSDDGEKVVGFFCVGCDATASTDQRRWLRIGRRLAARTGFARSVEDACDEAIAALGEALDELPFGAIYLLDTSQERLLRAATFGPSSPELLPSHVPLAPENEVSPVERRIAEASAPGLLCEIEFDSSTSAQRALAIAIPGASGEECAGVFVAAVHDPRSLRGPQRDFVELLAEQLGAMLSSARARAEDRSEVQALRELGEVRTTFFSEVSHEFRTPLTLILGTIEEVLEHLDGPNRATLAPQLEIVRRNAQRTLKLVNALLDFAQVESGRARANQEEVDLAALTVELASTFRAAIESVGIRFDVRCSLSEPAWVDRSMWDKIVLNLLSNAFKHTFQGHIELSLHAVGDEIALVVEDTGTGIAADQLPRVFDRFYRVERARARAYEGSGIGLALVQELVRMHSGHISLESAADVGTRVTVRLPRGRAHVSVPPAAKRTTEPPASGLSRLDASIAEAFAEESQRWLTTGAGAPGAGSTPRPSTPGATHYHEETAGSRILVVDDDADLRKYLVHLLSPRWTVEAFASATSALDYARRQQVELILTDIMMPGVDGFDLLRELRRDPKLRAIPVILLSARASEDSRIEGLDAGADDYLVKPFSAREACARVEAQLRLGARARVIQASQAKDEFLSVVSHELRTPLSPILLWARALQRGDVPLSDFGKAVDAITSSAERQLRVVDELLEFSRMVTGRTMLDRTWTDMADVVQEAAVAMQSSAAQAGLEFSVTSPAALGSAYVDAPRLVQVLGRLLGNAVRFTPRGGRVSMQVVSDTDAIAIAIADTGQGLSPEFVQHAFEPFRQFSTGHARSHGGLGVGLALSRHVLLLHGGTLEARSDGEGRGAVFIARIPRKAPGATEPQE